ncbi:MAG: hypothetical protein WC372_06175 [Candidatus Neomarinimicrobiota bacterium]|nr:hypothetical protein [Candidatus Neomarinimicrobiota bacterium]MDX9781048.1 hypothetical protein [bacterium]
MKTTEAAERSGRISFLTLECIMGEVGKLGRLVSGITLNQALGAGRGNAESGSWELRNWYSYKKVDTWLSL